MEIIGIKIGVMKIFGQKLEIIENLGQKNRSHGKYWPTKKGVRKILAKK